MSKATVLICDRCPRKLSTLAVTTLLLSNGQGTSKGVSLDLCEKHRDEMFGIFTPVKQRKAQDMTTRRKNIAEKVWGPREKKLLDAMKGLEWVHCNEMAKAVKIRPDMLGQVFRRLVNSGKLKTQGIGPGKTWRLA